MGRLRAGVAASRGIPSAQLVGVGIVAMDDDTRKRAEVRRSSGST